MAVPKKKTSKMKQRQRRANHDKVSAPNLSQCSRCGEPKLPHRVCPSCGYYKNREIVFMKQAAE
jgi:large subunit ribosomal protein L32